MLNNNNLQGQQQRQASAAGNDTRNNTTHNNTTHNNATHSAANNGVQTNRVATRETYIREIYASWWAQYLNSFTNLAAQHILSASNTNYDNSVFYVLYNAINTQIFQADRDQTIGITAAQAIATAFKSQSADLQPAQYLVYGILFDLLHRHILTSNIPNNYDCMRIDNLRHLIYCYVHGGEHKLAARAARGLLQMSRETFARDLAQQTTDGKYEIYKNVLRGALQTPAEQAAITALIHQYTENARSLPQRPVQQQVQRIYDVPTPFPAQKCPVTVLYCRDPKEHYATITAINDAIASEQLLAWTADDTVATALSNDGQKNDGVMTVNRRPQ